MRTAATLLGLAFVALAAVPPAAPPAAAAPAAAPAADPAADPGEVPTAAESAVAPRDWIGDDADGAVTSGATAAPVPDGRRVEGTPVTARRGDLAIEARADDVAFPDWQPGASRLKGTLNIDLHNIGAVTTHVTYAVTLPAGVTAHEPKECTVAAATWTCNAGRIAPGARFTKRLAVTGELSSYGSTLGGKVEIVGANAAAESRSTVGVTAPWKAVFPAKTDLAVTAAPAGQRVRLTVTNRGPAPVAGFKLGITSPRRATLLTEGCKRSREPGSRWCGLWRDTRLAPGASTVVELTFVGRGRVTAHVGPPFRESVTGNDVVRFNLRGGGRGGGRGERLPDTGTATGTIAVVGLGLLGTGGVLLAVTRRRSRR